MYTWKLGNSVWFVLNTLDCLIMEWSDYEEIYNSPHASTSSHESCESMILRNSHVEPSVRKYTMCHVDNFPFARSKIYASLTSKSSKCSVVSRAYEDAFLVEASGSNACVNGEHCECVNMFGFTLQRFCLPGATCDTTANMCVLCIRASVLSIYLDVKASGVTPKRRIQPYRNIIGVIGEYRIDDCVSIIPFDDGHIMEPFVLHSREKYSECSSQSGRRRVSQSGYSDFRVPPSISM